MQWHFHRPHTSSVVQSLRLAKFVFTTPNINLIETSEPSFLCGSSRALIAVLWSRFCHLLMALWCFDLKALLASRKTSLQLHPARVDIPQRLREPQLVRMRTEHYAKCTHAFIIHCCRDTRLASNATHSAPAVPGWGSSTCIRGTMFHPDLHIQINMQLKWMDEEAKGLLNFNIMNRKANKPVNVAVPMPGA